eukprot:m.308149 g.308149  ORF g.308149 m.308149 type:complete len:81 (-) comp15939_c2_seq9:798-1040(-)
MLNSFSCVTITTTGAGNPAATALKLRVYSSRATYTWDTHAKGSSDVVLGVKGKPAARVQGLQTSAPLSGVMHQNSTCLAF